MNLKQFEKRFHTKHLPYTTVFIIFALFVALLVTVVIAFNGSYNSYERSMAYEGQFCDPTHPCPTGEHCSSVTAAGKCIPYTCNFAQCPGGCSLNPTKDNDCREYCACEYGCSTINLQGGICIANDNCGTCSTATSQHCEARLKSSGVNAACSNDRVTGIYQGKSYAYTYYCHDSGRFCSPGGCPTGYVQYRPNPNPNPIGPLNPYGDLLNGCSANNPPTPLLGKVWACCQKAP